MAVASTDTDQEQDRHFRSVDDYQGGETGKVTLTITFPEDAVTQSPNFRPVEGILAMAQNAGGLYGLGPEDSVVARVGVEKELDKDKNANPRAGEPNGRISIVIHTPESLAASKQRGRAASMNPGQKALFDQATNAFKLLVKGMNESDAENLTARIESGDIDLAKLLELAKAS